MSDVAATEKILRKSIDVARARGYTIVRGVTRSGVACDVLGAVLVAMNSHALADADDAATYLGLSHQEAMTLGAGFDGLPQGGPCPAFWELGQRLAAEYVDDRAHALPVNLAQAWFDWRENHPRRGTTWTLLQAIVGELVDLRGRVTALEGRYPAVMLSGQAPTASETR